ncbi:MAG: beta-galactosidase [Anaerolineae bacterium]|nr:beta-galactosidase [Anaerolineae bacterium]
MKYLPQIVIAASLLLMVLASLLSACGSAGPIIPVEQSPMLGSVSAAEAGHEAVTTDTVTTDTVTIIEETGYEPTVDVDQVMSSPDYGMQVFLYWREEIADRDLQLVEEAGFRWVKQEMAWRELEGGGKGKWRWNISDRVMDQIDAHQLKVIVRLSSQPEWAAPGVAFPEVSPPDDLQDFYDYVYAVASRYRGRVEAYQIWNEPNLAREWGGRPPNPAEYVELLKVGYQAVKAADPNAIVISAGMAPTTRDDAEAMPDTHFIQGIYDADGAAYFDVLGVHAPGYKSAPELDPAVVANDPSLNNGDSAPEDLRRVYAFRRVEDLRELMVRNGDEAKKVVILEFGWTVDPRPNSPYHWHAVDPITQAQYFERAYTYAIEHWQPWIGVMSLIYVADPSWHMDDEETYWSIVYPYYPELRAAPAYHGLKKLPKVPPVGEK